VLFPWPLAFAARLLRISGGGGRVSNRALVGTALALAGALILLLGPPLFFDWKVIHSKVAKEPLSLYKFWVALELLIRAGRLHLPTLGLALVGMIVFYRGDWLLALGFSILLITSFAIVIVVRPMGMGDPIVIARYALLSLPLLLWLIALGIVSIGARLETVFRPAGLLVPAAWLVAMGLSGPLRGTDYVPNDWTNHALFQYYPDMSWQNDDRMRTPQMSVMLRTLRTATVSPFYAQLGRLPPMSLHLLEAPVFREWHYNPFPVYQRVHRQPTFVGFVDDRSNPTHSNEVPLSDGRFTFRRFVHVLDEKRVCEAHIDLVLFHKNLAREIGVPTPTDLTPTVPKMIAFYIQHYGPPVYEDARLAVFDMRAPCGRR